MRQHAIPQNILDVEFKLFTKFTIKEFAYLAIGIGFGGVMIYLTVSKVIPGILGVPIFLLSSAAGIFLGLVPINDQDADVFIKNYVTAITNPTQRVWLNKQMKEDRIKPIVDPIEETKKQEKGQIFGGNTFNIKSIIENRKEETTTIQPERKETIVEKPVQNIEQVAPSPIPVVEEKPVQPIDPNLLQINEENISNYQFNIKSLDMLPGNINIWLCTKDLKPIPNVITYLKANDGKVVYANKTGPNGYFLTNQTWETGMYTVEFQHPQYQFPKVQIILSNKDNKLPIKINAI